MDSCDFDTLNAFRIWNLAPTNVKIRQFFNFQEHTFTDFGTRIQKFQAK